MSEVRSEQRELVYKSFDNERDYQDRVWGDTLSGGRTPGEGQSGGDRTLDEFILYIATYADELKRIGGTTNNVTEKLNFVRKVGALCVAAGEQHGVRFRDVG